MTTDAPTEKPVELLLVVEIRELVSIRPQVLSWEAGGRLTEKTIEITVAEPNKTKVTEAQSSNPLFAVALEPAKQPGAYRLKVRPTAATKPTQSTIRITTMIDGRPIVSVIHVVIKSP